MSGQLLDLAVGLARAAGDLLLGYAGGGSLAVDTKSSHTDPVSEADRAAERLITEGLLAARPDDGILAEEAPDARPGTSGLRWVVDPLDGTVNYLYGIPSWGVSIACEDADGARLGVVHDPNRDETFVAERGRGATCNGLPVRVTGADELDTALIATGFAYARQVRAAQGRWVADLLRRARDIRRVGAAALDLSWTAAGRFDGFYEFDLAPWDRAAGILIVQEAGGVTSTHEVTAGPRRAACTVAGGRAVHDRLVTWLTGLEQREETTA
jgi:myo-inositol-1(or 4)-monophosphatase